LDNTGTHIHIGQYYFYVLFVATVGKMEYK